jgi:hypothetical protein
MARTARILYTSQSTVFFSAEMLEQLAKTSQHNNRRENISGLLLYSGGRFLQLLEGTPHKIQTLYEKVIVRDLRHTDCQILVSEPCDQRLFPNWGMGRLYMRDDCETAHSSWNALCMEINRQCPSAIFARDPVVACMHQFIHHFGDDLDAVMMASWLKSRWPEHAAQE